jgi:hypothetical protein
MKQIFQKIRYSISSLTGKNNSLDARQNRQIFENEIFLVSYPKSGNTWVRFFIANLFKSESVEIINFHNVHIYCPEWESNLEIKRNKNIPIVWKSHQQFNRSFSRVIYIVRDARDVYVSYYHYLKAKLPTEYTFKDFLENYKYPYSRWSNHVNSWLQEKSEDPKNFLIIRYEDLLENPLDNFSKIVKFIDLDIERSQLEKAIHNSSFKQMQNIEQNYGRKYNNDGVERFVRQGSPGEWTQYFGKIEWEIFKQKEDIQLLEKLGYKINVQKS